MNWYLQVLKKYAVFSGRACRKEFWCYRIIDALILLLLAYANYHFGINLGLVGMIYSLLTFTPSYAVLVRRLHDSGKSSLWVLLPSVPLLTLLVAALLLLHYKAVLLPSNNSPEVAALAQPALNCLATTTVATSDSLPAIPNFINKLLANPEIPKEVSVMLREQIPVALQLLKTIDVITLLMFTFICFVLFQLFFMLLLLLFTLQKGFLGENEYGSDPLLPKS